MRHGAARLAGKPREAQRAALVHVPLQRARRPGLAALPAVSRGSRSRRCRDLAGRRRHAAQARQRPHDLQRGQRAALPALRRPVRTFRYVGLPDPPPGVADRIRTRVPRRPTPLDPVARARPRASGDPAPRDTRQDDVRRRAAGDAHRVPEADLAAVAARDDEVDFLHGKIVAYLGRVSQEALTEEQTSDLDPAPRSRPTISRTSATSSRPTSWRRGVSGWRGAS